MLPTPQRAAPAQRQARSKRAGWIGGHQDQRSQMVQHQMLEPMHKEFMLGVVVEPRVKRYVEERKADPERCTPGNADMNAARPSCKQQRCHYENCPEPERR